MLHVNEGKAGSLVIDDRYAPLIVSIFIGEVDLEQGQWFETVILSLLFRESSANRKVIHVHDTTFGGRTTPEMRKFWAELSARNQSTMDLRTLGSPIVIKNALIRGVLTAVSWLNPKVASLKTYSSLTAAITDSTRILEEAGYRVDLPPEGYEVPDEVLQLVRLGTPKKHAAPRTR